jgi:hypothetical protein
LHALVLRLQEDLVAFDLTRPGGGGAAAVEGAAGGVTLDGDVVIALWARDHASPWDSPLLAFAFHTAFADLRGGGLRVPARHLDVPGTSASEFLFNVIMESNKTILPAVCCAFAGGARARRLHARAPAAAACSGVQCSAQRSHHRVGV